MRVNTTKEPLPGGTNHGTYTRYADPSLTHWPGPRVEGLPYFIAPEANREACGHWLEWNPESCACLVFSPWPLPGAVLAGSPKGLLAELWLALNPCLFFPSLGESGAKARQWAVH